MGAARPRPALAPLWFLIKFYRYKAMPPLLPLADSILTWPRGSLHDLQNHNRRVLVCAEKRQDPLGLWWSMEHSRKAQNSRARVIEHRTEPEFHFILRSVTVGLTLTPDLFWENFPWAKPGL